MEKINLKPGLNDYFAEIDEYNIHFRCQYNPSSDDVVVFFHGLACSMESFKNLFDKNYFRGKSLLLVDLIGFGKSSKPESFSYSMEDQAQMLEKLLSILPAWNLHIAAHSMGGAVALLLSSGVMKRVKSFANIEGNLVREDCGILSRGILDAPYEEYKDKIFKTHQAEFNGHLHLRFGETTPIAVYKSAASLVKLSDSGELINKFNALACKKCYIYGDENNSAAVLKYLGAVEKYMISNSGHGMMTDNPDEFYSALAGFITTI